MYKYKFAEKPATHLDVYTDTDFAGCSQTRRSTSGGCAQVNGFLVKHWSKTQPTIALSSGEAEYYAMVKAASQSLGIKQNFIEFGIQPEEIQIEIKLPV